MKVPEKTKSQVYCVLSQQHGIELKSKHIRLEINSWRPKSKPIGQTYFGKVLFELEREGFIKCTRGTALPVWDEFKYWVLA